MITLVCNNIAVRSEEGKAKYDHRSATLEIGFPSEESHHTDDSQVLQVKVSLPEIRGSNPDYDFDGKEMHFRTSRNELKKLIKNLEKLL